MEIKYTSDGKKVVVVGNLNSQEKIVQEIFVANGAEIPSGENFIVKALHDTPSISWKEEQTKKIESEYETTKFKYENELKVLRARYNDAKNDFEDKTKYLRKCIDKMCLESFDMVTSFLLGKFKYALYDGYSYDLVEISDFKCKYFDREIKLISLMGKDDGTFSFRLHDYSDGSGGSQSVLFFETEEDAVKKLSELINARDSFFDSDLKLAKKWNFKLDEVKVKAFKEKTIKGIETNIENYNKSLETAKSQIEEINNL